MKMILWIRSTLVRSTKGTVDSTGCLLGASMFELSRRLSVVNRSCRHLLYRSQHQSVQPFLYLLLCTWAYPKWDSDESLVHLTVKDKHSPSYGQFRVPGWPLALVFGPCDTPGEPANSTQIDPATGVSRYEPLQPLCCTGADDLQPVTRCPSPVGAMSVVWLKDMLSLSVSFFAHGNILCATSTSCSPTFMVFFLQLHSWSSCIGSRIGCCWIFPILFLLSTVTHPWGPDRDALEVVC